MIISLLIGITIGVLLALPPGPVGVTAMKFGLYRNSRAGMELALGNAMLDFLYSLIMIFATSTASQIMGNFEGNYPFISTIIQIGVVLAFFGIGIYNLKNKNSNFDYNNPDNAYNSRFFSLVKQRGPVLLGIAIALTNLANPTFIPTLAWISINIHTHKLFANNFINNLLYAIGFGLGNFIWITILVKLIVRYKHKFSDSMLIRIRQFAGFTFLSFGTLLSYRILSITKWGEVLHLFFAL